MEQMRERLEKSARRDAHRRETALRAEKVRTMAVTVVQSSCGRTGAGASSNNKFADLDSEEDEEGEGDAVTVVTKPTKLATVGRIFAVTGDYKKRSWADYSSDEE
jgi:hypothetical protein